MIVIIVSSVIVFVCVRLPIMVCLATINFAIYIKSDHLWFVAGYVVAIIIINNIYIRNTTAALFWTS